VRQPPTSGGPSDRSEGSSVSRGIQRLDPRLGSTRPELEKNKKLHSALGRSHARPVPAKWVPGVVSFPAEPSILRDVAARGGAGHLVVLRDLAPEQA